MCSSDLGKTHRAVERMLDHRSGIIGFPLRLLAREIYDRVRLRVGDGAVAQVAVGHQAVQMAGFVDQIAWSEVLPLRAQAFTVLGNTDREEATRCALWEVLRWANGARAARSVTGSPDKVRVAGRY